MRRLHILLIFIIIFTSVFCLGCAKETLNLKYIDKHEVSKIPPQDEDRTFHGEDKFSHDTDSSINDNNIDGSGEYKPGDMPLKTSSKVSRSGGDKVVFLTIDDGPSEITPGFLDVLKENGVHATFCVIGYNAEAHPETIKRAHEEGHSIINHSHNHQYREIYSSPKAFLNSFNKCNSIIDSIIEREGIERNFLRFPGGSGASLLVKGDRKGIAEILKTNGYNTLDWSLSTCDTSPYKAPPEVLSNNATNSKGSDTVVVLMHDCGDKHTTMSALPLIIKYYKDMGYSFKTIRNMTEQDLKRLKDKKIVNRIYNIE